VARYTGPVCRLCRREGMKLFLKGDRCFTEKCAIEKRNYAPGQHGKGGRIKSKLQGYGLQLREKQKVKRLYRMQEEQFRLTFSRSAAEKGVVGEVLLGKLERRLDNVIYRLGFGSSRDHARQIVRHGHVSVNGRRVDIPSYQVNQGDQIALDARASKNTEITASVESVKGRGVPKWLELDAAGMKGRVLAMPARDDINFPIQEQLIVELYSK
jgi:small subunit ribosomal protein S4